MRTYTEEFYTDWFNDNSPDLRKEYCELMSDNFCEYCKEQFKQWCEQNE